MKYLKIFLLIFVSLVVYTFVFNVKYSCPIFKNKLACYNNNLELRLNWLGVDSSKNYLKKLYDDGFLSQGQCHTLGHLLGQSAAYSGVGMIEAMEEKSSFCGWAFFHGVMEGLFGEGAGHGSISVQEAHKICNETKFNNGIEQFNCFHALGHGFYSLDYNLINSLARCDLAENNKRGFCHDGVFMAMTFPKEGPREKEENIEPFSVCGESSDDIRKLYCYWRLIPIKVFTKELELPDKEYIKDISDKISESFKSTFWNGFGRELDSRFNSNKEIIYFACEWGKEFKRNCILGAAMHMIFYDRGDTVRAEEFCRDISDKIDYSSCVDYITTKIYPGLR